MSTTIKRRGKLLGGVGVGNDSAKLRTPDPPGVSRQDGADSDEDRGGRQ